MQALASFFCGLIFGSGLMISGMTQPTKVLGFFGHIRPLGPYACFRYGGCAGYLKRRLHVGAAAEPALVGGTASLAESNRYRPTPDHRLATVWHRLGPRRFMPGSRVRKSREPIAPCGRLRHCDDRRNECAGSLATFGTIGSRD